MTTHAVVFVDVGQIEVREINMPAPGPGEVQIRTAYSTISAGTEGWVLKQLFTWGPATYPCVPGYQRVGTILQLGPEVEGGADALIHSIGEEMLDRDVMVFFLAILPVCLVRTQKLLDILDGLLQTLDEQDIASVCRMRSKGSIGGIEEIHHFFENVRERLT